MIGIIDYEMGNIQSVVNAFNYIGYDTKIVKNVDDFEKVNSIVLPGVGAFEKGIKNLQSKGFKEKLNQKVLKEKKPFLGICLGMQLICKESYEFGHHFGLGWIEASVVRFEEDKNYPVPHVGWNNLIVKRKNYLVEDIPEQDVYFVHSYYVNLLDEKIVPVICEYGIQFAAVIEKDNIFAVQFHPEKSQKVGLGILERFAKL